VAGSAGTVAIEQVVDSGIEADDRRNGHHHQVEGLVGVFFDARFWKRRSPPGYL
jgi:hypothetical protein